MYWCTHLIHKNLQMQNEKSRNLKEKDTHLTTDKGVVENTFAQLEMRPRKKCCKSQIFMYIYIYIFL